MGRKASRLGVRRRRLGRTGGAVLDVVRATCLSLSHAMGDDGLSSDGSAVDCVEFVWITVRVVAHGFSAAGEISFCFADSDFLFVRGDVVGGEQVDSIGARGFVQGTVGSVVLFADLLWCAQQYAARGDELLKMRGLGVMIC